MDIANQVEYKGFFINGKWENEFSKNNQFTPISPAFNDLILPTVYFSTSPVDKMVNFAHAAQKTWRTTTLEKRINLLLKVKENLFSNSKTIAKTISIEMGKPYSESLVEAGALCAKIDITINEALKLVKTSYLELSPTNKGEIHYKPKGVLVVIGPFNFPVHLSNGQIIPALLTGNTCILKPSEKSPLSAQLYIEAFEQAGLPPGVIQLAQGDHRVATDLITHPLTDGCLATCSYDVGCKIQEKLAHNPEKIICLEMGGKNGCIVWDNPNTDLLADDLIRSCYLTTGQRCTALSRVYIKRKLLPEVLEAFHQKSKNLLIHQPFHEEPKPFMGPIVSKSAMENFFKYSDRAKLDDCENIMRPKQLSGEVPFSKSPLPNGYYVTPSINYIKKWNSESSYQSSEIFGPDVFFCPIDSIEEGVSAINSSKYGLSFSLYTKEEKDFDTVADQIEAGLLYWNRPTVGASGKLPFGGWKRSGNHRPAGLFSIYGTIQVQARFKSL